MDKIQIALLTTDHTARSVSVLLNSHPRLDLAFATTNPEALIHYVATYHPAVILLESSPDLPDIIPFLTQIQRQNPRSQCLILAHELDVTTVRKVVDAGALGYLLVQSNFEGLVAAIPLVHAGKLALSPQVTHLLLSLL